MDFSSVENTSQSISGYSEGSVSETQGANAVQAPSFTSTLGKMDAKTIEDILALLPKPWLDPITSLGLWNNLDLSMGLLAIHERSSGNVISNQEAAIVLSMLDAWSKSVEIEAQISTESAKAPKISPQTQNDSTQVPGANPLVIALQNFIAQHTNTNTQISTESTANIVAASQFLKNSPILLSSLTSIDPQLLQQGYQLAEAQIVFSLLEKWSNTIETTNAYFREQNIQDNIARTTQSQNILRDYINSVQQGEETLSQPVLSMVLAGMLAGALVTSSINSISLSQQPISPVSPDNTIATSVAPSTTPVNLDPSHLAMTSDSTIAPIPVGQPTLTAFLEHIKNDNQWNVSFDTSQIPQIAQEMTQIAQMVVISAAYWAIPGALSLSTIPEESQKPTSQKAALTFAITMVTFIEKSGFTQFVRTRLKTLATKLTDAHFETFTTALKFVMLSSALAALEKATMTKCTGKDFVLLIQGKIPLAEGDFRLSLIKRIQDQLSKLPAQLVKEMIASFASYLDYAPSLESLYDPVTVFLKMWDPRFLRETPLQHSA